MINQERLVKRFLDYVQVDSESCHEAAFAGILARELKALGFFATFDDSQNLTGSDSGNLFATLPGNTNGFPIMFSCHMDTVKPGLGIKPTIAGGIITSDGTTILGGDDKAGLAAIMEALHVLTERKLPHGGIELVFSVCEENGLRGAKNFDIGLLQAQAGFVLDSGGEVGDIVLQGPSQEKIEIIFHGKAAHAGESPENGISAIYLAAQAVSRMKLFRIDEETTANIGNIEGGGATNIIPALVRMNAEARSLNEGKLVQQVQQMKDVCQEVTTKFGGSTEIHNQRMYPSFLLGHDSMPVRLAEAAARSIGILPAFVKTGGGSDTNIYNSKGLTTVTLGIAERKPHTLEESMAVSDLVKTSELVLAIIKEACFTGTI
jgi:tripeptide aminopeptidase